MNGSEFSCPQAGAGFVLFDWAACVVLFLSALVQFLINRSPAFTDPAAVVAARWVLFVALVSLSSRIFYTLTTAGDFPAPVVTVGALFGFGVSTLLLGLREFSRRGPD